jgi:hypothetical protein
MKPPSPRSGRCGARVAAAAHWLSGSAVRPAAGSYGGREGDRDDTRASRRGTSPSPRPDIGGATVGCGRASAGSASCGSNTFLVTENGKCARLLALAVSRRVRASHELACQHVTRAVMYSCGARPWPFVHVQYRAGRDIRSLQKRKTVSILNS